MTLSKSNAPRHPGACRERTRVLAFVMPFASPAAVTHATKLLDCLEPVTERLLFVGDSRVELAGRPAHVERAARVPTLHYLGERGPRWLSAVRWLLALLVILVRATWTIARRRRSIDVVVCFLGTYYTPLLACARLLGIRTVVFEPGNEVSATAAGYGGSPAARVLAALIAANRTLNRRLADIIAVESLAMTRGAGMDRVASKLRQANLYAPTGDGAPPAPVVERPPVIGFVGRLAPVKGVSELVDAFAGLDLPGYELLIVGDGPLRADLERRIAGSGGASVRLTGWQPPERVGELLRTMRLLVLPSAAEGMPNGVIEAMARGTPVLATAVGGVPDIVTHGVTGYLLPDTTPAGIAGAIAAAIGDPRLDEVAAAGRAVVTRHLSRDASALKWREIIRERA